MLQMFAECTMTNPRSLWNVLTWKPSFQAAALSLLAVGYFGGLWFILLFVAQPDDLGAFEAAMQTARYLLSPEEAGNWTFIILLASLAICLTYFVLFLFDAPKAALSLVVVLLIISVIFHPWFLAVDVALPLLVAKQAWKGTQQTVR